MLDTPVYLGSFLAPLRPFLDDPDVTDIYINCEREVWTESLGGVIARTDVAALDHQMLIRLSRQIAASSAQGISREHPLLAARLPDGSRVQIAVAPATRGDVAIAIRKHVTSDLSLDDYAAAGAIEADKLSGLDRSEDLVPVGPERATACLRKAIGARSNILISGGTSTGKTTFLNALLREIPSQERLILIEDTPELSLTHQNSVGLVAARSELSEAHITATDLLVAALRMRPDRIILGELRGEEAFTFLRAVNTGHPGSMTTIHADTPARAIEQLALLVLQAGTQLRWEDVQRYVRSSVDVFVQLERREGRRVISQLLMKEHLA